MASPEVHHFSAAGTLGTHHNDPEHHHDADHDQIRNKLVPPRNGHGSPVFNIKAQIIDRNLIKLLAGFVCLHLAYCLQKILTDGGFKVKTPVRKICIRDLRCFCQPDEVIVADGNPCHFTLVDHIQQCRIFDAFGNSLVQASVE